jgi:hypothetical protein
VLGIGHGSDGISGSTDAAGHSGVFGNNTRADQNGWGLFGSSRGTGVRGDNQGPSFANAPAFGVSGTAPQGVAVAGQNNNTSFPAIHGRNLANGGVAVLGQAENGGWGIYGLANGANSIAIHGHNEGGLGGFFVGDVIANNDLTVRGTLTASTKLFRIDHPTDPKNKVLVHCSVESSELLNIYSGTVKTDADGRAVVQLPDYFEALNTDVRYQLTAIKEFSQAIVTEEVRKGRFVIATDKPNVKVSWQLTAVRCDSYALAHPLIVEQEKSSIDADLRQPQGISPIDEGSQAVTLGSRNLSLDYDIH